MATKSCKVILSTEELII